MKGGITNTLSEKIMYDWSGGAVSKSIIKTEYYSDTSSTWVEFEDVEGRSIELSQDNPRVGSYSFLPPSKKLTLQLNNFGQIYSTGSGDPKASILKKNLLVRAWSGFESTAGTEHFFKQGTFIIDDPKLDDAKVNITGRDYLRKALETEINLPTYTNTNIQTVITDIMDRCDIPYDTANWDSTSTTVTVNNSLVENINNISGWKALDDAMDALNAGNDDWRFRFDEDGNAELKILETATEADFVAHYFYNIESISKGFNNDKQLQRVTCVNKDIIVNSEELLKNITGTASSSLHVTYAYSTNATAPEQGALYVRYTDINSVITSESARGNTGVTFATNTGSAYDISIYGCRPSNVFTVEVFAERGNSDNIIKNEGSTHKRVNPFMSQSMCQKYCDYNIDLNADPAKQITLSMVHNPLLELQDNCLVFDLYTYTDDLYGITGIKEEWNEPSLKHTLTLKDRGFDFGEFIWDRNGYNTGFNDLQYDMGLVFDQDCTIGGLDSTDYADTKEIQFS